MGIRDPAWGWVLLVRDTYLRGNPMNRHHGAASWLAACLFGGLLVGAAAPAIAGNPSSDVDQAAMNAYRHANPITNWPAKKLKKAIPELKQLQPVDDQSHLAAILSAVNGVLAASWKDFPGVTSTELIAEGRHPITNTGENPVWVTGGGVTIPGPTNEGQGDLIQEQFRYSISVNPPGSGKIAEARFDAAGNDPNLGSGRVGFLRTSGFASQPLFFNAANQKLSDFRYLGTQEIDGRPTEVVAFAEHPDPSGVLSSWSLSGQAIPVLLEGVAWIDPSDFHIAQMRTQLLAEQPKLHFGKMTTIIKFKRQELAGGVTPLWLPDSVRVEAEVGDVQFLNIHRFSDYKSSGAAVPGT